jgi:hypothetical protein
MHRNRQNVMPCWRRRLALIAGACGMFLLNLAFVALPVAADGHGGSGGGHHDGQGVEVEHHGNNGPGHDVNDDHGVDGPNHDVNDDRGNDANDNDVNDDRGNDANDHDANDDRGNDGTTMVVLLPKTTNTGSGR